MDSRESSDRPERGNAHRQEVLRLLSLHRPMLFAFTLSIVRDFDAAEDVLQDVSLVVCERYASFQIGTNFGAWAREIARRRILARRRESGRLPLALPEESLQHVQAGFDAVHADNPGEAEERMKALRACLEKLSASARDLLEMRYRKGLRPGRIAQLVAGKTETVRKTLYRTRRLLGECIEQRLRLRRSKRNGLV